MSDTNETTYESLLIANGIQGSIGLRIEQIDDNVKAKFEKGAKFVNATGYGESFWTRSFRVETELPDKEPQTYFLKIASGDGAKEMMHGEYVSQQTLYEYLSTFVPKPIGWGTYQSDPNTHFFLSHFVEMTGEIPSPAKFCAKLANLHLQSMEKPTDGHNQQYGFYMNNAQGNILVNNQRRDKWEAFFTQSVKHVITKEAETQGPSQKITDLSPAFFNKVIPRLLRPLEKNIKPCLVHGDLWHGNTSVAADTNEPFAFDSCVLWAHNEYEMAMWRAARYKFGRAYYREYHKYVPVSAPEEDYDDRNALYAIRTDLLCSALYGSNQRFRELAIDEMTRLVNKYPDGIDSFEDTVVKAIEH